MHALDDYFATHYFTAQQLANAGNVSTTYLHELIQAQLLPAPSYVVSANATVTSFAMGVMAAPGASNGEYFHQSMAIWLRRVLHLIDSDGLTQAPAIFAAQFAQEIQSALAEQHHTRWPLPDSFSADGSAITEGLDKRVASFWLHFLNGTFGLCVASPDCATTIVHKEIVQEKLTALTRNGEHCGTNASEAKTIFALCTDYAQAAMPFSPIDYPRSSRKRLVDDLRKRIYGEYPALRDSSKPTSI